MREFNRFSHIDELKHNNARKQDRIDWALSGRSERGLIQLLTDSPGHEGSGQEVQKWNAWFIDQLSDFPDPLAHDDGLDAVAYVDQLSETSYVEAADVEEWVALDAVSGY
jgi:hypothetical protein